MNFIAVDLIYSWGPLPSAEGHANINISDNYLQKIIVNNTSLKSKN